MKVKLKESKTATRSSKKEVRNYPFGKEEIKERRRRQETSIPDRNGLIVVGTLVLSVSLSKR